MLSLQRYMLVLVLWIAFFFNIERLHVNKNPLVNIAFPTYLLVTVFVVLGLVLPQWHPTTLTPTLMLAFFSFVGSKILYPRPFWGEAYTYLTLFELGAVLITAVLAHRVGQLLADFSETVKTLLLAGLDKRIYPPEQAEVIAKREMLSARRRNYPLSVMLIQADTQGSQIKLSTTAQEIQRVLARRMGLLSLTRLLATNLRSSDSIVDESEQGRWLLLTAELDRSRASIILRRLNEQTSMGLGVKLKFGIASYPDQGLTLEDLLLKAEQDLEAELDGQRDTAASDHESTPLLSQEPRVDYASHESRLG